MTASRARSAGAAAPGRRRAGIRLALMGAWASAALAAAVLAAGPASAGTGVNAAVPVVGYGGLCLDDQGASTADLTPVQVYSCNSTGAQQWALDLDGLADPNTIQALGKCLDVQHGGTANGTPVDLDDCNGTRAQTWILLAGGEIYNPQSGKCLDDTNSSTTPGTQAEIWDCTGSLSQSWSAAWQFTGPFVGDVEDGVLAS